MSWDFETDAEVQEQLDWMDRFVRERVEPLDLVLGDPYDKSDLRALELVRPLTEEVRAHGLWACHLDPDLGGPGYGQLRLALMNEILGRSRWAPSIFGCQAPDSGNAEILARFGTDSQKRQYLQPLLDGEISSCYSMTELDAGADPTLFTTQARRDGSDWVIEGEKWFSSNARYASFVIVMVVTDPDADKHKRHSLFIVPIDTPGLEIVRNVGVGTDPRPGSHGYLSYRNVKVPQDNMLGEQGSAFAIAQARLSGGRVHHAMRTVGQLRQTFEMMTERAKSRQTRAGTLGSLTSVQETLAECWIEIEQFRLLVLRTAWLIDKHRDYRVVRKDIAAVKVAAAKVLGDVVRRAMHLHGALGVSNEMPLAYLLMRAEILGIADGPSEIHKQTIARDILKEVEVSEGRWPKEHIPTRRAQAEKEIDY